MPANHTPGFLVLFHSLKERHLSGESWESIASSFNTPEITRAHVRKLVHYQYEPRKPELRRAYGLSEMTEVEACPLCGLAHTHAHDEQVYNPATQIVKPLPKPRKPRTPRIAIRKDDMQKAAKTIWNNLSRQDVLYLSMLLQAELQIDELLKEKK